MLLVRSRDEGCFQMYVMMSVSCSVSPCLIHRLWKAGSSSPLAAHSTSSDIALSKQLVLRHWQHRECLRKSLGQLILQQTLRDKEQNLPVANTLSFLAELCTNPPRGPARAGSILLSWYKNLQLLLHSLHSRM